MRLLLVLLCTILPLTVTAQSEVNESGTGAKPAPAQPAPELRELAQQSSVVALVQTRFTEYQLVRDFPNRGYANLEVLIAYKPRGIDRLNVYEQGLHDTACYFPDSHRFDQQPRYLVFLNSHPDYAGEYAGHPQLCKVPVLVTADNQYAVPYPLSEIRLPEGADALVQELEYQDINATVWRDKISYAQTREWLEKGFIKPFEDDYVRTKGIPISKLRQLIGREYLTSSN